jgi:regulatory protein
VAPASSGRSQALRLIKFRPRTESELRQRLSRKGIPEEEIQNLLREFRQKGLVDDAQFARLFVTQRVLSKPVGRRMLMTQLRSKGVAAELAEGTVAREMEGQDERTLARGLAEERAGRMRGLSREAFNRRMFGFLRRRGFSGEIIHPVIRDLHGQR